MTNPPDLTGVGGAAVVRVGDSPRTIPQRTDGPVIPRQSDQARCPLIRAAWRTADPDVVAVIASVHPPRRCPAARRAVGRG